MNIEIVTKCHNLDGTSSNSALHTDQGKCHLFVQNFSVPDVTSELIDSVEANTTTWAAMVSSQYNSANDARGRAHQTISDILEPIVEEPTPSIVNMITSTALEHLAAVDYDTLVYALSTDWKDGNTRSLR